jgi:hypothetical protein
MMPVGCISTPLQRRLGPGAVRNEMMARPDAGAECPIRGRLSKNRCIHRRCRSIRVSLAVKRPRPITVSSALVARIVDA